MSTPTLFCTISSPRMDILHQQEEALCANVFDIQQPLIIVFNQLEELEQVAITASNPYISTQLVNVTLKLTNNFYHFKKGLVSWFERPTSKHTLLNFKAHFKQEYQAIKE